VNECNNNNNTNRSIVQNRVAHMLDHSSEAKQAKSNVEARKDVCQTAGGMWVFSASLLSPQSLQALMGRNARIHPIPNKCMTDLTQSFAYD
jgi:hypothetical protein